MDLTSLKVLLIDDEPDFARQIGEILAQARGGTFELFACDHLERGLSVLSEGRMDVLLMDLSLPDGAGLGNIKRAQDQNPRVPVIVLGHADDEAIAIEAVHEGAQDYLVKAQLNPQLLGRAIRYAIERQRADAALMEAEQKYRGIFEHIVEGIFQTTPDGRYMSANSALARIYGYASPEDLRANVTDIGRKLYVEPGRRDEFIQLMQENDTVTDFESRIYRKDGTIIWIAENVRAIRNARGRLLYYEGTVEDVTARREAQEKLRNSETLYHSLVETLPQNIFRKDLELRFTFTNQRFSQLLGCTPAEVVGKTDFDFYPPEMARKYQEDDRRVMELGKPVEAVEEHRTATGELVYVQVVKTPLCDADGRVIGVQGIFWDISERRRAEEKIRLATEELARSREALHIKNAQMEEDLGMAREIQQTMIPQQYPVFPWDATQATSSFRFSHRYLPTGTVGGDYFNVVALSNTEAGIFICDVMGHGVRSALVAAMVRAVIEELKPLAGEPGALLTQLNRDLCSILRHTGSPMLTTAFYLVADAATGCLRFANAGHPKPLLAHRDSQKVESLGVGGGKSKPALGLFEDANYTTGVCPISEGDLVMLFTDGLYEVEGAQQQLYSHEMLAAAVRRRIQLPASTMFDEVLAEIKEFAVEHSFADDVCLVGIEVGSLKQFGK